MSQGAIHATLVGPDWVTDRVPLTDRALWDPLNCLPDRPDGTVAVMSIAASGPSPMPEQFLRMQGRWLRLPFSDQLR